MAENPYTMNSLGPVWQRGHDSRDPEVARLTAQNAKLVEALKAVEWVETEYDGTTYEICPWCHAQLHRPDEGHRKGCIRQAALAFASEAPKEEK